MDEGPVDDPIIPVMVPEVLVLGDGALVVQITAIPVTEPPLEEGLSGC
jgi:hypothetical protein